MTIKEITRDILNIARNANVSSSETISRRQIESWVNQYRLKLMRQSIDKGNIIPDQWIQELNCMELELVDRALCDCIVESGCIVQRTKLAIPKLLSTATFDGLLFVGTLAGKPYQIGSEQRAFYAKYRKWSSNDRYAYIRDSHIFVSHAIELKYISIAGIFEDPLALENYSDGCTSPPSSCFNPDTFEYPISLDLLPIIKEMIFKLELGIMLQMPSDKHNDDRNVATPNSYDTQKE